MNKSNTIHIQPIFSSFFCHIKNIEVDHAAVHKYCKKIKYMKTNDQDHDMSKNLFVLDDFEEGKNLHKTMLKYVNESIKQLNYKAESQIVNCWVNRVKPKKEFNISYSSKFLAIVRLLSSW